MSEVYLIVFAIIGWSFAIATMILVNMWRKLCYQAIDIGRKWKNLYYENNEDGHDEYMDETQTKVGSVPSVQPPRDAEEGSPL